MIPCFTCPYCAAVSYNRGDIEHHFCGRCHRFAPAAAMRENNPENEPVGHFTGRCMRCGSADLWDDNAAYGCRYCGAWWCDIEPRLIKDSAP